MSDSELCSLVKLQEDIASVQLIGGYCYGFCYGFFLVAIFIAAVCTEYREMRSASVSEDALNVVSQSQTPHKSARMQSIKNIGKNMVRLKEIYFVILVHMFDTLTDFLIMLEWYEKGRFESKLIETQNVDCFNSITYIGCFVCSCVILLFYRILSAHYVYSYYQQSRVKAVIQSMLQFLDLSIFYEVYQSHLHQSTTDNLSYLSKLEKTFESSPQLILQLYVLMRELSQQLPISWITVISILFSLVSLSSKVISDDKAMFFKRANKKHKVYFYSRALFRICEISARLFAITLFATYFGANFLVIVVLLDLMTNILLYDDGLLDTDPLNVMSYLLCVMNLGITPTTHHQLISKRWMQNHAYFAKMWHAAFIFMTRAQLIVIPCIDSNNRHYYFSYYLIRSRCIQSFIILLIILMFAIVDYANIWRFDCFICTDYDDREPLYTSLPPLVFLICAYLSVITAYVTYSKLNISYMKSGMILDRDPWILFINFNFFDSIRAFKERNGPQAFNLHQTLKKLINENARLPTILSHNDIIETYDQLPYLIHEVNELHNVQFIYQLLEYAIFKLHDNFLSFFLDAYIIESIVGYDPLQYINAQNGFNILQSAVQRKNNLIIQTVYNKCALLLARNEHQAFFELWSEKYVTTIDIMIQNDASLLDVKHSATQKSIFFHCIDNQHRNMMTMLADRLSASQFTQLCYYEFNIFMYAIQSNDIYILQILKDKIEWKMSQMTMKYINFDVSIKSSIRSDHNWQVFQLHPIAFAVINDNHETLQYLLNTKQGKNLIDARCDIFVQDMQQADVIQKDEITVTPLMLAAIRRKPILLQILLKAGADPTIATKEGKGAKTALDLWPVNLSKLEPIIRDAKKKAKSEENKAFIQHLQTLLRDSFSDLNIGDYRAYIALKSGVFEANDTDTNQNIEQRSSEKATDFYVKLLIQNDSSYALKVLTQQTKFDPYWMNLKGAQTLYQNSFIRLCVRYNSLKLLRDMLQNYDASKRKQIIAKESRTSSPYLGATSVEICQALLDLGFSVYTKSYDVKKSLLYHHSFKRNYNIVKWLCEKGCRLINRKEAKSDNHIIEACAFGFYPLLPVLIQLYDIDPLAMFAAVRACNITTIRILMRNGLNDIDSIRDAQGRTPLHIACSANNELGDDAKSQLLYHLLFNLDWNLNVEDDEESTPLHYAAEGDEDRLKLVMKKLCQYADNDAKHICSKRNKWKLSALHVAIAKGIIVNVEILLKSNKCDLDYMLEYCWIDYEYRMNIFELLVKRGVQFTSDVKVMLQDMENSQAILMKRLESINKVFAEEICKSIVQNLMHAYDINIYNSALAPLTAAPVPHFPPLSAAPAPFKAAAPAPVPTSAPLPAAPASSAAPLAAPLAAPVPTSAPLAAAPASGFVPQPAPLPGAAPVLESKEQEDIESAAPSYAFPPAADISGNILVSVSSNLQKTYASQGEIARYSPETYDSFPQYEFRNRNQYQTLKLKAESIMKALSKYRSFQENRDKNVAKIQYDTYETFDIWVDEKEENEMKENDLEKESKDEKEENDIKEESKETAQFNTDIDFIRDYRDLLIKELDSNDTNEMITINMELDSNKNKEILDLCLTMIDNNDTSEFAESYFNDIVMHYMFDTSSDWQILNNICAASQYEPILLKAYAHETFKPNIDAIICAHENTKNAQLIVESLTFSYSNRYSDCKDKRKVEKKDAVLRECVEFIMRQTIYEKVEIIKTKTLKQKLQNYIQTTDDSKKNTLQVYKDDKSETDGLISTNTKNTT